MKKIIVLLIICIFAIGCSQVNNQTTEKELDVISQDVNGPEVVEEMLDNIKDTTNDSGKNNETVLYSMTKDDQSSLNDAISTYLMIDPTLEQSTIQFRIETNDDVTSVIFIFENAMVDDNFKYTLLPSLYGALTVTELSIEYDNVIAELYDDEGVLIKSMKLNE